MSATSDPPRMCTQHCAATGGSAPRSAAAASLPAADSGQVSGAGTCRRPVSAGRACVLSPPSPSSRSPNASDRPPGPRRALTPSAGAHRGALQLSDGWALGRPIGCSADEMDDWGCCNDKSCQETVPRFSCNKSELN